MPNDPNADPECIACKGIGKVMIQIDEDDVDLDVCECVCNPTHKRFRASIYIDISAYTKDRAVEIAQTIVDHLADPEEHEIPTGYYNPYIGGAGEITRDLIQTAKNLEKI